MGRWDLDERDDPGGHSCRQCGKTCDCGAEHKFECDACTLCYQGLDGDDEDVWND